MRALRGPLRKRDSHLWERHPQDWYVEPEWVDDALFATEKFKGHIYDPACGIGRIVVAALKAGYQAAGSDIVDRGWDSTLTPYDFLTEDSFVSYDNIVCNPPYGYVPGICEQFVFKSLCVAHRKVAMLLTSNWIQGDQRSRWLEQLPLKHVYFICPRPSMPPGPVIAADVAPGSGTTDYAWYVFERGHKGPWQGGWIRRD